MIGHIVRIVAFSLALSLVFTFVARADECAPVNVVLDELRVQVGPPMVENTFMGSDATTIASEAARGGAPTAIQNTDTVNTILVPDGAISIMVFSKENCVLDIGMVNTDGLKKLLLRLAKSHT